MGFLRRILGGGRDSGDAEAAAPVADQAVDAAELDADERQHELDMLRSEAARLDELSQRQLKYADYAWQPPDQGGEERADLRD